MEIDQTCISKEEIDYWSKEFPLLEREVVAEILSHIDIEQVKDTFWGDNPQLEESIVNCVVAQNAASSFEYHLYHTINNEAQ